MDIPRNAPSKTKRYFVIALAGAVVVTAAVLTRLDPAVPAIDRTTVWIDTVRQGEMIRQVRGQGTLEPEQVFVITAVAGGRVDQIYARSGASVTASTPILQMSNPDVELEASSAEHQLSEARAQLANLRTTAETQRLTQESAVATARLEYQAARRELAAMEPLAQRGLASSKEAEDARDKAERNEVNYRTAVEQAAILAKSGASQIELQQRAVEQLGAVAQFRRQRVGSMRVFAGSDGVLQTDTELQPGQWVQSGMVIARVAGAGHLKATLHVSETEAKDVRVGQPASIDTRDGIIAGRVARIDPSVKNGTVTVDVALEGRLPPSARPELNVSGTVEVDRLQRVIHVGRPFYGEPGVTVKLFRLTADGAEAMRVSVKLGRASTNRIEVIQGLGPGDRVIISDMSAVEAYDHVRLR